MTRDIRHFNPATFAKLDADMWVAYYNHRFFRLFVLLLKLNYTYFRPNLSLTMRGAYHSAVAAIVFRKTKGNEDTEKILHHLTLFYNLLAKNNAYKFDYDKAAGLELEWWLIDRYPNRYKQTREEVLARGMATIYNVSASKMKIYGEKRAQAMELLGDYHHDTTTTVDWVRLRVLLKEAYAALHGAVDEMQ